MASRDPQRPNVVVVLSDDQGYWALGCAGTPQMRTPHLDRLAAEGTRLENLFCSTPVCSPSRASLLTGQIPSQHGVHDAVHHGEHPDAPVEFLTGAGTYVEQLAASGYHCAHVGKWHLGNSGRPQAGFVEWYALAVQGSPYWNAETTRGGPVERATGYTTDVLTDEAIAVLDRSSGDDTPLLLSLCYTAPHSPWLDQHPDELLDQYPEETFEGWPFDPEHPWSRGFRDGDGHPARVSRHVDAAFARPVGTLRAYCAAVTGMDRGIGRLMDRLDAHGLRGSTLVVFLSDNGFSAGHHGIWGKGNGTWPPNMYDTAVKVPGIVSQPGRVRQGVVVDDLVSIYDFRPTLLDWAGVDDPDAERRPGRSFAGLLDAGLPLPEPRDHVVVFDEYGPTRMIRTRDWKYVHRYPDGPHELYDLRADPGERRNLIGTAPDGELRDRLESWFRVWADPERDGRRFPVRGLGQLARIDDTDGARAFVQARGEGKR